MSKTNLFSKAKTFVLLVLKLLWKFIVIVFETLFRVLIFISESNNQNWEPEYEDEDVRISLFKKGRSHIKLVLQLASILIKADGTRIKDELDYVKNKIAQDFSHSIAESWMSKISIYLKLDLSLEKLANKANRSFTQSTKIQMLHFLAGIAAKDGMLTSAEFSVLKQIGMRIRIPFKTLKSILALYNFITEEEAQTNRDKKNKPLRTQDWKLKKAYTILELLESATNKEVKKAYRKLAKLHHPDKVIHMGAKFQKGAEEKFMQISEAYNSIKDKREFV